MWLICPIIRIWRIIVHGTIGHVKCKGCTCKEAISQIPGEKCWHKPAVVACRVQRHARIRGAAGTIPCAEFGKRLRGSEHHISTQHFPSSRPKYCRCAVRGESVQTRHLPLARNLRRTKKGLLEVHARRRRRSCSISYAYPTQVLLGIPGLNSST